MQQYICQRVFKDKPDLCRIAIPYIYEDISEPKAMALSKQKQSKVKYSKPIPQYSKKSNPFKASLNFEKTPINEYLNYELSEEINFGLKEAKMLSDEIKHIK